MTYLIIANIMLDIFVVYFLLKANQHFRNTRFKETTFTMLVSVWLLAVIVMAVLWRITFGLNIF